MGFAKHHDFDRAMGAKNRKQRMLKIYFDRRPINGRAPLKK